jgi:hypothetical protein
VDDVSKLQQTAIRGIIAAVIIVISAVTLNHINEDRVISKCIQEGNNPIECAMAVDGYSSDKILLNAIQEIKAERK